MSWFAIAKKEYVENVRNAWIIAVSILFLALVLITSTFASVAAGEFGFSDIVATMTAMQSVAGFFLPILALMLGFGTLAGERETGSLALLVAQPVSRDDILLGKALGLWAVLATSVLAGIGVGGLVILGQTSAGPEGVTAFVTFLVETLLWGAAWISITLAISAFFDRRGTAIAGSIGVWFLFGIVWNLLVLILGAFVLGDLFAQGRTDAPPALILTQVLNPNSVYDGLLFTTIEGFGSFTGRIASGLLDAYHVYTFSLALVAWIVLPYLAAHALFTRKDV